jgi:hypothetical protein
LFLFYPLLFRAATYVFIRVIVPFSLYSQSTLSANASWYQLSKLQDSRRHLSKQNSIITASDT